MACRSCRPPVRLVVGCHWLCHRREVQDGSPELRVGAGRWLGLLAGHGGASWVWGPAASTAQCWQVAMQGSGSAASPRGQRRRWPLTLLLGLLARPGGAGQAPRGGPDPHGQLSDIGQVSVPLRSVGPRPGTLTPHSVNLWEDVKRPRGKVPARGHATDMCLVTSGSHRASSHRPHARNQTWCCGSRPSQSQGASGGHESASPPLEGRGLASTWAHGRLLSPYLVLGSHRPLCPETPYQVLPPHLQRALARWQPRPGVSPAPGASRRAEPGLGDCPGGATRTSPLATVGEASVQVLPVNPAGLSRLQPRVSDFAISSSNGGSVPRPHSGRLHLPQDTSDSEEVGPRAGSRVRAAPRPTGHQEARTGRGDALAFSSLSPRRAPVGHGGRFATWDP